MTGAFLTWVRYPRRATRSYLRLRVVPSSSIKIPNLFLDPVSGLYYLYWLRLGNLRNPYNLSELMVASASTPGGLVGASASVLAIVPFTQPNNRADLTLPNNPVGFGAPDMMYAHGTYYLSIETAEGDPGDRTNPGTVPSFQWMTRVLVSNAPDGKFVEIPGNPILSNNSACFFQHVFGDTLHAYTCKVSGWASGT